MLVDIKEDTEKAELQKENQRLRTELVQTNTELVQARSGDKSHEKQNSQNAGVLSSQMPFPSSSMVVHSASISMKPLQIQSSLKLTNPIMISGTLTEEFEAEEIVTGNRLPADAAGGSPRSLSYMPQFESTTSSSDVIFITAAAPTEKYDDPDPEVSSSDTIPVHPIIDSKQMQRPLKQ